MNAQEHHERVNRLREDHGMTEKDAQLHHKQIAGLMAAVARKKSH